MGGVPIGEAKGLGACCGGYEGAEDGVGGWPQAELTGWPTLLPDVGGVAAPREALGGDGACPFGMGMIL